jgi:hypothetical protein
VACLNAFLSISDKATDSLSSSFLACLLMVRAAFANIEFLGCG